jgi:hypothetical protein
MYAELHVGLLGSWYAVPPLLPTPSLRAAPGALDHRRLPGGDGRGLLSLPLFLALVLGLAVLYLLPTPDTRT